LKKGFGYLDANSMCRKDIKSRKPLELLNIPEVNGAISLRKANKQGILFRLLLSHGENTGLSLGKQDQLR